MTKPKLRWLTLNEAVEFVRGTAPAEVSAEDLVIAAIESGRVNVKAVAIKLPSFDGASVEAVRWLFRQRKGFTGAKIKLCHRKISDERKRDISKGRENQPESFVFHLFKDVVDDWRPLELPITVKLTGSYVGNYLVSDVTIREKDLIRYREERLFWVHEIDEGQPRREMAWRRLSAALVALERDGRLTHHEFPNDPALSKELRRLTNETLDARTIRESVRRLYHVLVPAAGRDLIPKGATLDEADFDLGAAMREGAEAARAAVADRP